MSARIIGSCLVPQGTLACRAEQHGQRRAAGRGVGVAAAAAWEAAQAEAGEGLHPALACLAGRESTSCPCPSRVGPPPRAPPPAVSPSSPFLADLLPTGLPRSYMAMLNTLDGVRDETGRSMHPYARWTR